MFGAIKDICDNAKKLDINSMMRTIILDPTVQAQLIDLNLAQMDAGINAKGVAMPEYSNVSVTKYGKTPGPFTLKDTGDTRNSMFVSVQGDGFTMNADTGLHGVDLSELFDPSLGETPESIEEIKPEITERLRDKILSNLLNR